MVMTSLPEMSTDEPLGSSGPTALPQSGTGSQVSVYVYTVKALTRLPVGSVGPGLITVNVYAPKAATGRTGGHGRRQRSRTDKSALTHASGAAHRLGSNERLEFLGDAILGAVVCEALFQMYPDYLEGDLTRIKSTVVSRGDLREDKQVVGS